MAERPSQAGFLGNSFSVGSITGIRVRVHTWLPVYTALSAFSTLHLASFYVTAHTILVHGPILWGTVLFHELWHCWAARAVGTHVEEILLWPLGGLAFIGRSPSACADMQIAAAGPASHVPQILLLLALLAASNRGSIDPDAGFDNFAAVVFYSSAMLNFAMLVFNLCLPCYPLDGGRILADALLLRGMAAADAARVVVFVSVPICLALGAYGIYGVVTGHASAALTCFVALWLLWQTHQLWQLRQLGQAHAHPLFANALGLSQQQRASGGA